MRLALRNGGHATIDGDWARLLAFVWERDINGYVRLVRNWRDGAFFLHRLVARPRPGDHVDHRNGDKLDNTRQNLRRCSNRENSRNSGLSARNKSGFKGVSWARRQRRWRACIAAGPEVYARGGKRNVHLGYFRSKLEAARAYDAAARCHFGEFARCNFGK